MSSISPMFPIHEPLHFSDYGFDPQINYFQVLEEAMKPRRETPRSIDLKDFKLQKPISKDDSSKKIKKKSSNHQHKKRWWKNALFFFKFNKKAPNSTADEYEQKQQFGGTHLIGSPAVYAIESTRPGSTTPLRAITRPNLLMKGGDVDIPYVSLRETNNVVDQGYYRNCTASALPIYLVR